MYVTCIRLTSETPKIFERLNSLISIVYNFHHFNVVLRNANNTYSLLFAMKTAINYIFAK